MLVARNTQYVQTQKRMSRIRTFVGLAFFVAGSVLLAVGTLQYLILSYGLVIAGFFFFNTGLQGITKWGRKVRNDQMLDDRLRRLSDRYTLIHYPAVGNRNPDHVLVHETGLIVMNSRETYGKIEVSGKTYRKAGQGLFGRWLGASGPQLGQPANDNSFDRKATLEALAAQAGERGWPTDFPVDGLVVFIANRAILQVSDNADPPAVKLPDLLAWVQAHTRGMPIVLTNEVRQQVADYLIASGGATEEGRIDPRGATVPDEAAAKRGARRPSTPSQVVKERSERERQARARTTAAPAAPVATAATIATAEGEGDAAPAGATRRFGRRRVEAETTATTEVVEVMPVVPLVPGRGMARVKRRPGRGG